MATKRGKTTEQIEAIRDRYEYVGGRRQRWEVTAIDGDKFLIDANITAAEALEGAGVPIELTAAP